MFSFIIIVDINNIHGICTDTKILHHSVLLILCQIRSQCHHSAAVRHSRYGTANGKCQTKCNTAQYSLFHVLILLLLLLCQHFDYFFEMHKMRCLHQNRVSLFQILWETADSLFQCLLMDHFHLRVRLFCSLCHAF